MTKDPFDAALDGFERWTAGTKRKLSADPETAVGEVETLLDLMRNYLDVEGPADLGAGDLRELLLRIYPRKMTVFDADDTQDTIAAVHRGDDGPVELGDGRISRPGDGRRRRRPRRPGGRGPMDQPLQRPPGGGR